MHHINKYIYNKEITKSFQKFERDSEVHYGMAPSTSKKASQSGPFHFFSQQFLFLMFFHFAANISCSLKTNEKKRKINIF